MHEQKSLTVKQESFCKLYIEHGNASEAYRRAYNAENMQAATINRKAFELTENGNITARLKELRKGHAARHAVTVDSLVDELEDARQVAKADNRPSAMVSATMGKARLMGLDKGVTENVGELSIIHINAPDVFD
ncbi:MAG: terminase small subunit [Legionellales bacterium]